MTQSLGDVVGLEWSVNYRLQPVIDDCCEATGVDSLEAVGQTLPSIDSEADEKELCGRTPVQELGRIGKHRVIHEVGGNGHFTHVVIPRLRGR